MTGDEALPTTAETVAAATLDHLPGWVWNGETLPIPIEKIATDWYALHIRDVDDLSTAPGCPPLAEGQVLSGLLLPDLGEIWVNRAEALEWPSRRRFTIAHELGHWRMHRSGQQSLFCRKATVDEDSTAERATTLPPLSPTEEEANFFAAALLMPPELMRHHYAINREFGHMCETFGSSARAMSKRMRQVI